MNLLKKNIFCTFAAPKNGLSFFASSCRLCYQSCNYNGFMFFFEKWKTSNIENRKVSRSLATHYKPRLDNIVTTSKHANQNQRYFLGEDRAKGGAQKSTRPAISEPYNFTFFGGEGAENVK